MDGIASDDSLSCKASLEGLIYYGLIFQQTSISGNVILTSFYVQKITEQYTIFSK